MARLTWGNMADSREPAAMRFLRPSDRQSTLEAGVSSTSWPFTVAAGHPCFAGHFDGEPVLPGVAHLSVALEACTLLNPALPPLVALEDVRFMRALLPGDACHVAITDGRESSSRRFEIRCQGDAASRGVLVFAGPWAGQ